jgi:hypothetical protein
VHPTNFVHAFSLFQCSCSLEPRLMALLTSPHPRTAQSEVEATLQRINGHKARTYPYLSAATPLPPPPHRRTSPPAAPRSPGRLKRKSPTLTLQLLCMKPKSLHIHPIDDSLGHHPIA